MYKVLLRATIAAAAVVIGVTAVIVHQSRNAREATPAGMKGNVAAEASAARIPSEDPVPRTTTKPDDVAVAPMETGQLVADGSQASGAEALNSATQAPAAPEDASTVDATESLETTAMDSADAETVMLKKLIRELSPDQEAQLRELLNQRRRQQKQKEAGNPPISYARFQEWDRASLTRPTSPTVVQREQLKTILEQMIGPRMDAALGPIWQRRDELQLAVIGNLLKATTPEQQALAKCLNEPMQQELRALQKRAEPLMRQFDNEYRAAAKRILTVEQFEMLDYLATNPLYSRDEDKAPGGDWSRAGVTWFSPLGALPENWSNSPLW